MTGCWRVDHLPTGHTRNAPPTFHATEAEAIAEETRLHMAGVLRAVAWLDSTYEGDA